MWQYKSTDELYHHGIIGQKWGRRRYQNHDGTLTIAGKKHYKEMGWSKDAQYAARLKRKKVSQMSNEELRKLNERKNLESNYKKLNPSKTKKVTKAALATIGTAATVASIADIGPKFKKIYDGGKSAVNKIAYNKWLYVHRK